MGLFDQDDVPIINSILGNNGMPQSATPQSVNPATALGLNRYNAGDSYSALNVYANGAQPIPTDVSGAGAQPIPLSEGAPPATPVMGPQASGQVPMPTSAFQPAPQPAAATPNIGMQPGTPAPQLPSPINVGAPPGAGYPAQPPMPRPAGTPAAPGGMPGMDVSFKANWLGRALGASSPQQGQNIASQFLSGLGAGMSAAARYANKPGGAAFAGSFGAALQGAQARGDAQQAAALKARELAQRQQQQDFMQKLLTRKQGFAETNAAHTDQIKRLDAATRALEGQARAGMYDAHGQYYIDHSRWSNGKQAWQLTVPGREHQLQTEATQRFAQRYMDNRKLLDSGNVGKEEFQANQKQIDADRDSYIGEQRKLRGIDPKNVTQGTAESPHAPQTQVEIDGMPAGSIYRAPSDGRRQDGTSYKKGDLMVRGGDKFNSEAPPQPPAAAPAAPGAPSPQAEAEPDSGPSTEEIFAAAAG
jgi:hypothetical protein